MAGRRAATPPTGGRLALGPRVRAGVPSEAGSTSRSGTRRGCGRLEGRPGPGRARPVVGHHREAAERRSEGPPGGRPGRAGVRRRATWPSWPAPRAWSRASARRCCDQCWPASRPTSTWCSWTRSGATCAERGSSGCSTPRATSWTRRPERFGGQTYRPPSSPLAVRRTSCMLFEDIARHGALRRPRLREPGEPTFASSRSRPVPPRRRSTARSTTTAAASVPAIQHPAGGWDLRPHRARVAHDRPRMSSPTGPGCSTSRAHRRPRPVCCAR